MSARATAGEKAGLAALALLGLLAGGAFAGLVLSATRQGGDVAGAFRAYHRAVQDGRFPADEHCF